MSDSRQYPPRPICAVGAIVRHGDTVLLIRRGQPPRAGEWSVPGGAVELGETLHEAIAREVREECGIEIEVGDVVAAIDIIQRDDSGRVQFHYAIVDFAGTFKSGSLNAMSDITEAHWVARGDLDRYPMNAQTRAVIEKAFSSGAR